MEQFTRTYPDGTRATYTVAPGSTLALQLAALKPLKKPPLARSAKRQFPHYAAGITSTADYINAYYGLNSHPKIAAWPRHETNWLSLYQPLPDEPAAVYTGADTVETIGEDE